MGKTHLVNQLSNILFLPLTSEEKSTKNRKGWAINSVVECYLHTVEVTGSNPVSPTILFPGTPTFNTPSNSLGWQRKLYQSLSLKSLIKNLN